MKVYLDNAATTPIAPEVVEVMVKIMKEDFGNPSSTHQFGRKAKSILENSRRQIAAAINCLPSEICFTSGGTEADNMAIKGAVHHLGVDHIITSEIEHHAVVHTIEECERSSGVKISLVNLLPTGKPDINHLRKLLEESNGKKTLVSLMHANNEIGTISDIKTIGELCREYQAYFHSDTVQTLGHLPIDLQDINVHFITGAAHKFHGPKGVGFLYINKDIKLKGMISGGAQERSLRAGTENIYGIAGMAEALKIATQNLEKDKIYISGLRKYFKEQLLENFPDVEFNGCQDEALYTVLHASFPEHENASMLLFLLDIDGVAVSGGSACSSGSNQGSHVLRGLKKEQGQNPNIRFSFSRYNTREEIDYTIEKLKIHLSVPVHS